MASPIKIVLGAGTWGRKETGGLKCLDDKNTIQQIISEFKSRGYNTIDSARSYGEGTSEEILAELDYAGQGLIVDTKIKSLPAGSHKIENIALSTQQSMEALKTTKVHIMYLHGPDRSVPLEEVVRGVNEQYKKGHFEKFGLSNYTAAEIDEVVKIAKEHGYVLPTVYQGHYNLLYRNHEADIFPVLRKHGIAYNAFSPTGGRFLTGEITKDHEAEAKTRFDAGGRIGEYYRKVYFKPAFFQAIEKLQESAKAHGIAVVEIAYRWLVYHSALKQQYADGIVTGANRVATIKSTLDAVEKGPLPADVVKVVEGIWEVIKEDNDSQKLY